MMQEVLLNRIFSSVAAFTGDATLVATDVASPNTLAEAELARIKASLRRNGVAVVRGFLTADQIAILNNDARTSVSPEFDFGAVYGLSIPSKQTVGTSEFSHPFLYSAAASALVTSPVLQEVVEDYLGAPAVIHHGLFQQSRPADVPLVDWHVDTGSNKVMNGTNRFPDRRLRMITYLTDVRSGGLSYILDTRSATKSFLDLAPGELFPQDMVPSDANRRVTIEEPAGTIIFFDAHGLHRPEPPKEERYVLNTWFARNDFGAKLPPILVSVANIPSSNREYLHIFGNARGVEDTKLRKQATPKENLASRLLRRLGRRAASQPGPIGGAGD